MQKRIDEILNIIKEQGYVTVKYLCDELHYSTATINRDLNDLQAKKLIVRHYGGAEIVQRKEPQLVFRYHKMRPVKRILAKRAAEFIREGMTVFIDGSSTTQNIGQYITKIKNITVISNNLNLVSYLSEAGVKCICIGGEVIESPCMVSGSDAVLQARRYTADVFLFSTIGFSQGGMIYENDGYLALRRIMIENSDKKIFLCDHQKTDVRGTRIICDFSEVDTVISDVEFPSETKERFKETEFIKVEAPKTQKEEVL